jgi:hypothetical protein
MWKEYRVDILRIAKLIQELVTVLEQGDAVCSLVSLLMTKEPSLNV